MRWLEFLFFFLMDSKNRNWSFSLACSFYIRRDGSVPLFQPTRRLRFLIYFDGLAGMYSLPCPGLLSALPISKNISSNGNADTESSIYELIYVALANLNSSSFWSQVGSSLIPHRSLFRWNYLVKYQEERFAEITPRSAKVAVYCLYSGTNLHKLLNNKAQRRKLWGLS
jgi:hypothetical protein